MRFIVEIESDDDWIDEDFKYYMESGYFDVVSFRKVEE
jgi:hypothetical protein